MGTVQARGARFSGVEIPGDYACRGELCSEPVIDPTQIAAAVAAVSVGEPTTSL